MAVDLWQLQIIEATGDACQDKIQRAVCFTALAQRGNGYFTHYLQRVQHIRMQRKHWKPTLCH